MKKDQKEDQIEKRMDDQPENQSLEELFEALEKILTRMEDSSASLEDTFRDYEAGVRLLKTCNEKIDRVEKQVLALNEEGCLHEFQ